MANTVTDIVRDFTAARRVGTPLITINTFDPGATADAIASAVWAMNERNIGPVVEWDCIHGLRPRLGGAEGLKEQARAAVAALNLTPPKDKNPVAVLAEAESRLPARTILIVYNAHRIIKDQGTPAIQAIWNLRDPFKLDKRMLVLLGDGSALPSELQHDVIRFDEPLPAPEQLREIVTKQHDNAKIAAPSTDTLDRAVDALAGLPPFPAEQQTAMSLTKDGIALDALWERKRKAIEQTPGLSVWRGGETFETIGGYENVKAFTRRLIAGPNRPAGVVFIDEIEKQMAGAHGDNTGVSQGQHQALLTYMQDHGARGLLFVGHPGSGKSAIAKAIGNTAGVPTIAFDMNAMKNSLVGASEQATTNALKTVQAVCQGRALFVATCNSLDGLSPELRRRFRNGTFFFDLPTAAERDLIWSIYLRKYRLDGVQLRPFDEGWTGAEIENCCDQAYSINGTLQEAAGYIVPQYVAMRDRVEARRREANGRIISASYPGVYDIAGAPVDLPASGARGRARSIEVQ